MQKVMTPAPLSSFGATSAVLITESGPILLILGQK